MVQTKGLAMHVSRQLIVALALLASSTLQAACMNFPPTVTCRADGANYLSSDANSQEVCERFQQQLFTSLAGDFSSEELSVDLTIEKTGTISVVITREAQDAVETLVDAAIDVMDRPLNFGDLDRLAGDAAKILNEREAGA